MQDRLFTNILRGIILSSLKPRQILWQNPAKKTVSSKENMSLELSEPKVSTCLPCTLLYPLWSLACILPLLEAHTCWTHPLLKQLFNDHTSHLEQCLTNIGVKGQMIDSPVFADHAVSSYYQLCRCAGEQDTKEYGWVVMKLHLQKQVTQEQQFPDPWSWGLGNGLWHRASQPLPLPQETDFRLPDLSSIMEGRWAQPKGKTTHFRSLDFLSPTTTTMTHHGVI